MAHKTTKQILFLVAFFSFLASACYYDKQEILNELNNNVCDTTNVTFSGKINPIISQNCVSGCHGGAAPAAGIALETHAQIKASIEAGRFIGSITHLTGFSAMPKNSTKLSDCNITLIKAWMNAGYPNN